MPVRSVMKDVGDRGLVVLSLAVTLALGTVPASADVPLLVTREWLSARLSDTQLRIVDMSTERATYRRGHIRARSTSTSMTCASPFPRADIDCRRKARGRGSWRSSGSSRRR